MVLSEEARKDEVLWGKAKVVLLNLRELSMSHLTALLFTVSKSCFTIADGSSTILVHFPFP